MAKLKLKGNLKVAKNVVFKGNKAVKHFNKYDEKIQRALINAINKKAKDPKTPADVHDKKLSAPDHGEYRMDVGKYRITYDISLDGKLVINLITARGNTGWSEA
jgi:mRNA-degrading endonuclease RelE of RelBE toxin-antitoxin system